MGETLRGGPRAGAAVALAPLLTDGPVLLITALLLHGAAAWPPALALLSLVGAGVLVQLGASTWRAPSPKVEVERTKVGGSLRRAVLTNLFNPHPWIFWAGVGTPATLKAQAVGPLALGAFLGAFFFGLVGSKLLLALALGRMRRFLASRAYRWVMRAMALSLWLFAALLIRDGVLRLAELARSALH